MKKKGNIVYFLRYFTLSVTWTTWCAHFVVFS